MENEYLQSENQLEQALALNKILLDTLDADRKERRKTRKISIICAVVCLVSLFIFTAVLGILASGIQIETTTTTTTETQSVEGDSATINNGQWEQNYGG